MFQLNISLKIYYLQQLVVFSLKYHWILFNFHWIALDEWLKVSHYFYFVDELSLVYKRYISIPIYRPTETDQLTNNKWPTINYNKHSNNAGPRSSNKYKMGKFQKYVVVFPQVALKKKNVFIRKWENEKEGKGEVRSHHSCEIHKFTPPTLQLICGSCTEKNGENKIGLFFY